MRILISYSASSTHVATTFEYLTSFMRDPNVEVEYLHVTHEAVPNVDLNAYDAVINFYCARLCFPEYVSRSFVRKLARFEGVKALIVQDEYNNTNHLLDQCREIGFDIIFTCLPQTTRHRVYSDEMFPNTDFHTTLTGFLPDDHLSIEEMVSPRPVRERSTAIGYRGRRLGLEYGRLGRLKYEVGVRFRDEAAKRDVTTDIGVEESDRIYGDDWFRFIASTQCMLGSPSGSNVFDWDGSLASRCRQADTDAARKALAKAIEEAEEDFQMEQISPRAFECAMLRTPMVLMEGNYSDILMPGIHFIPVAEDFGNLDEVFAQLRDTDRLQEMADRTYHDLVESGRFTTSTYAANMIRIIAERVERNRRAVTTLTPTPPDEPLSGDPAAGLLAERPTERPLEAHPLDRITDAAAGLRDLHARLDQATIFSKHSPNRVVLVKLLIRTSTPTWLHPLLRWLGAPIEKTARRLARRT